MAASETTEDSFKSPSRKLVRFFKKSRDSWKVKHQTLKKELKLEQNQRRAVEKSREAWRDKARAADQRVRELERQLAELEKNHSAALVEE